MLTTAQIGEEIRKFRQLRGLTQEQLAERIEVSVPQVWKYEAGANRLNSDRLQAIASTLEVPVSALFKEEQGVEKTLRSDEVRLIQGYRTLNSTEQAFLLRIIGK
ncbi:MAG: helix-turn-helix transcriptional regulator [Trichlorobacter sp.]|nr:helix-turn-helix transcriptional regulator [Trichlorobacter sp.]